MIAEDLIIDVGLHHGQDSEFYLKKGFRVVAVEANPECVKIARERLQSYVDSGQFVIENVGIGPQKKVLPFYVNQSCSEWSSFNKYLGSRGGAMKVIDVQMIPFREILQKYGIPYYLKIDIEGHDQDVIRDLWAFKERPLHVSYEAVPQDLGALAMLHAQGYQHFKFIDQRSFQSLRLANPAAEGRYVDHEFELGSSGPFGEESPGVWGTFTEAVFDWVRFWKFEFDDRRHEKTWCDFHAKRAA